MDISNNLNQEPVKYRSSMMDKLDKPLRWMSNHHMEGLSIALSIIILDLANAMKIGWSSLKGKKREFHHYDLNPKAIPPDKSALPVTLLIHGRMHNQGVWINTAKHLSAHQDLGPLFTINLPSSNDRSAECKAIEEKILEIKKLYKNTEYPNPPIQIVAFSDGGLNALSYMQKSKTKSKLNIKKIIMLGCHLPNYDRLPEILKSKLMGINASHDFLDTEDVGIPSNKIKNINTTHLGLVNSKEAIEEIYQQIRPNFPNPKSSNPLA